MLREIDKILLYDHDRIDAAMQRHYQDEKRDRRKGVPSLEKLADML